MEWFFFYICQEYLNIPQYTSGYLLPQTRHRQVVLMRPPRHDSERKNFYPLTFLRLYTVSHVNINDRTVSVSVSVIPSFERTWRPPLGTFNRVKKFQGGNYSYCVRTKRISRDLKLHLHKYSTDTFRNYIFTNTLLTLSGVVLFVGTPQNTGRGWCHLSTNGYRDRRPEPGPPVDHLYNKSVYMNRERKNYVQSLDNSDF
jgi:hypothetical protein